VQVAMLAAMRAALPGVDVSYSKEILSEPGTQ